MSGLHPAKVRREFPARYRLQGSQCENCGQKVFPARVVCPACRSTALRTFSFSAEGKVVTCTVIHVGPASHKQEVPYAMAVVELTEGVRLTCQVVDVSPGDVRPGMPVRLEFRRIQEDGEAGVIAYGHKAVPVPGA